MKTLLTTLLIASALLPGESNKSKENLQELDMLLQNEIIVQEMVQIFDYQGNLIKKMSVSNVGDDQISIADYFLLESSHFAFSYLGNYYYLRD